ncbi:MAG: aldehyde dehydrogenase [Deltaproteobacteria bacterium]|nr:MAG: aldehyde dehydrogenase [Deltaproteobacteria bacterium]
MSDLLTREQYASLFADLRLPVDAHINGEFAAAKSGMRFETVDPATGEVLARIAACDSEDVDHAVEKGREAFAAGTWSRAHPSERKTAMIKLANLIERDRHELAVLESRESGKPIRDVATIDIPETIACLTWYAEACDKLYDQVAPAGNDALGIIVREPVGVVACVLPWNFPLLMMAWKLGPALAAGNSVIVKPAEQTSMTALRVAELAVEAGIPVGVLHVVTGLGPAAGKAIGLHDGIGMVSFTGSTEVGRLFLKYAADSNLKRVVLECGGKNPAVVLSSAGDLDHVAEQVVTAVFWNMGENCTSNSRLIVHESLKDDLLERVLDKVRSWRIGDPLEPANNLGAMVSQEQFDVVMGYIAKGKDAGAECVLGGEALEGDGLFIPPTIFDGVTPQMTIAREEIFGPVLAVMTASTDAEAIEMANDTNYGLQASVFSDNVKHALRAAREIRAGTVTVNCYGEGDITTPFGGYKESGFGGRDNGLAAFEQYTETKTIWVDLGEPDVDVGCD